MLDDKVFVITGSGGGIGRATAVEAASRGARVVVSDVDDDGGAETVALVEGAGGQAHYVHCDVRDRDQIQALVDGAVQRFGGIDVLHNNAGVHESDFGGADLAVDTLADDVWERVFAINLRGPWLATKLAAPHLRASTRGPAIINAASIGGVTGYAMANAYCASKAGMISLTRTTAIDLGPTVRCNCYCPGSVDTPMVQKYFDAAEDKTAVMRALTGTHIIPRLGEPQEVAQLVCFLASDEARWITGASFPIDGGSMAWRGAQA